MFAGYGAGFTIESLQLKVELGTCFYAVAYPGGGKWVAAPIGVWKFFLLSYPYSLSNTVECMFEALLRQKLKIGCDRNIYNKLHLESADTNANHFSKTSTKFEIWSRFTDWSGSSCLLDHFQNVVDSFPCRHQSFHQVSIWKAAGDCMKSANKSRKTPHFGILRKVEKWSSICARDEMQENTVGIWALPRLIGRTL